MVPAHPARAARYAMRARSCPASLALPPFSAFRMQCQCSDPIWRRLPQGRWMAKSGRARYPHVSLCKVLKSKAAATFALQSQRTRRRGKVTVIRPAMIQKHTPKQASGSAAPGMWPGANEKGAALAAPFSDDLVEVSRQRGFPAGPKYRRFLLRPAIPRIRTAGASSGLRPLPGAPPRPTNGPH